MECLLCGGEFVELWSNSYDEPPETKSQCETCGLTNYYGYYSGEVFYLEGFTFEGKNIKIKTYLDMDVEDLEKGSLNEYVDAVKEKIKEKAISLEEIKESRRNRHLLIEERAREKARKEEEQKERWKTESYNEKELEVIQKFLDHQEKVVNKLDEQGVISKSELIASQFGVHKKILELDSNKLSEYMGRKILMQKNFATSTKVPVFAPTVCYNCSFNIYGVSISSKEIFGKTYQVVREEASAEKCANSLITGCPRCSKSFVD